MSTEIYLLNFTPGDTALVLRDGDKYTTVMTEERTYSDSYECANVGINIAHHFDVQLYRLDVPSSITDLEDWGFDDGVQWLIARNRESQT